MDSWLEDRPIDLTSQCRGQRTYSYSKSESGLEYQTQWGVWSISSVITALELDIKTDLDQLYPGSFKIQCPRQSALCNLRSWYIKPTNKQCEIMFIFNAFYENVWIPQTISIMYWYSRYDVNTLHQRRIWSRNVPPNDSVPRPQTPPLDHILSKFKYRQHPRTLCPYDPL